MQALGFETSGPSNFHQTASNMYCRPPLLCPEPENAPGTPHLIQYSTFNTARHIMGSKELESSIGTPNAAKSHVVRTFGRTATDRISK